MLGDDIKFLDNNGVPVRDEIALSQGFFNPPMITSVPDSPDSTIGPGIGPILKYLASDPASEVDTKIVNSVRNFLFGEPGAGGFDLSALNMQRGRDHGLSDYNTIRAAYGLPRVASFGQITADNGLQRKLHDLYNNVNNIDPWIGGLAENHISGTSTGPLIRAVLIDQFTRLRDGDRFWFQNQNIYLPPGEPALGSTTLAAVISRNTEISNLQSDVFFFRFTISGTVFNDANRNGIRDPGEVPLGGRTVQLEDRATGAILATKSTDRDGHYLFNNFDEIETGQFRVREIPQNGWVVTTTNPVDEEITRGDQFKTADFGNARGSALLATASRVDGSSSGRSFPLIPSSTRLSVRGEVTVFADIQDARQHDQFEDAIGSLNKALIGPHDPLNLLPGLSPTPS